MANGFKTEGGQPRQDRTPAQNTRGGEARGQQGRGPGGPLSPRRGEREGWQERPHEELVAAFRNAIRHEQEELGDLAPYHSPVKIMNSAFLKQVQYSLDDEQQHKQRGEFFAPILHAWEIIAYEHYGKGSINTGDLDRHYAALDLCGQYQRAKALNKPHPEIIRLSDPLQVKILDAAAEAVDIPHHKDQADFEIPEHLREYEEHLRKANEERERRR